ncbi:MAG: hypothetical protein ACLS5L_14500 [Faecalimonas sp.]
MLKVDFGRTEIKGSEPHILTEFTMLARNLRELLAEDESTECADMKIAKAIELSKKTEDELDEEISKSISILGRMMGSVSKGKSAKTKENSDVEPSTGNSAFDDFLKDIFGGGAK